jgi:hypothetical protein
MDVLRAGRELPEPGGEGSGVLLPLISIALSELRQDFRHLIRSNWDETVRRRAQLLVSTLAEACEHHRMDGVTILLRSMASLARISREEASPLLPDLRAKFDELLNRAARQVAALTPRETA